MDLHLLERAARRDFWADDNSTLDAILKLYERGLVEVDFDTPDTQDADGASALRAHVRRPTAKGYVFLESALIPS